MACLGLTHGLPSSSSLCLYIESYTEIQKGTTKEPMGSGLEFRHLRPGQTTGHTTKPEKPAARTVVLTFKDGLGFRVQGLGFRVQGLGYRVQVSGFTVWGSGSRVELRALRILEALQLQRWPMPRRASCHGKPSSFWSH